MNSFRDLVMLKNKMDWSVNEYMEINLLLLKLKVYYWFEE